MDDFKVYNNCLVSNLSPHEVPNYKNIEEYIKNTGCMMARWTDKFDDINYQSSWWYLIKDGVWDISQLNSHDRNEIKKGIKNFSCSIINPNDYSEDLYSVYLKASIEYSKLSRNIISYEEFALFDKNDIYIAAFDSDDGRISAYAKVFYYNHHDDSKALNLSVIKIDPSKKRKSPSAALLNFVCEYFLNELHVDYICDGERSIRHVTNFQNYLEKYFKFRKAYCRLNIQYSNKIKFFIFILYPFRNIFKVFSNKNKLIYNIWCILNQHEILKTFK